MLDEQQLASVARHLSERSSIAAAFLIGSAASGRLRSDSDVDIAVLPSHAAALPLQERLSLAASLSQIVRREVDLGLLSTRNLVYAKEAVTRGTVIFERDHAVTARFAMYVLSMYASLQESRREVLRAYVA
jgi:predicted nucleotidyltransferase